MTVSLLGTAKTIITTNITIRIRISSSSNTISTSNTMENTAMIIE